MMQFDTERFINEVRRHRFLYDAYDENYKDSTLKKNCWVAIATKFRISKTRANIKWKSIRDRFMRERKAYIVRQQTHGTCSPPKWRLYDMLQSFLDNTEPQSATLQSDSTCISGGENSHTSQIMLGSEDSSTEINCFTKSEETEEYVPPCAPLPHTTQIPSLIYAASPSSAAGVQAEKESTTGNSDSENKRCKEMEIDTQITSLLTIASDNLSQVLAVTQGTTVRDDTYYYFLYVMERFRKLNPQQQRQVRRTIDQTFYDLEGA